MPRASRRAMPSRPLDPDERLERTPARRARQTPSRGSPGRRVVESDFDETVSGEVEPVFAEPWEAQAFGLVTHLHANGLFTWQEWADAFAAEPCGQDIAHGGADRHRHRLAALERLLAERGLVSQDELEASSAAWQRAAHATPHGEPILLENDPGHPVASPNRCRADPSDERR